MNFTYYQQDINNNMVHFKQFLHENALPESHKYLSGKVLHTLRDNEDLVKVIRSGLRAESNVTLDGGKPNQSLGYGITLVYNREDVDASPKGYNENDGILNSRIRKLPVAIFIEQEEVDMITYKTFTEEEIAHKLEQMYPQLEAERLFIKKHREENPPHFVVKEMDDYFAAMQEVMNKTDMSVIMTGKGKYKVVRDNPNYKPIKLNWYGETDKLSKLRAEYEQWHARYDELLDRQLQEPGLKKVPETNESQAVEYLIKGIPENIPVYLYELSEDEEVINIRKVR